MNIEDLDGDRMKFNPKDDDFMDNMLKAIPQLKHYKTMPLKRSEVFKYVAFMYDPMSPVVESMDDYWARKFEAAETAGFACDKGGKFNKNVENMILGKCDGVNDVIIAYVCHLGRPKWNQLVFFHETMCNFTKRSIEGEKTSSRDVDTVGSLHDKIRMATDGLLMSHGETDEFLDRFYYRLEKARLSIRPEDYAKRITEGDDLQEDGAYGEDYQPVEMKFIGENEPISKKRTKGGKSGERK